MSALRRLLREMVTKADDPQKVDWPSIFVLVLYGSLALSLVCLIVWFASIGVQIGGFGPGLSPG